MVLGNQIVPRLVVVVGYCLGISGAWWGTPEYPPNNKCKDLTIFNTRKRWYFSSFTYGNNYSIYTCLISRYHHYQWLIISKVWERSSYNFPSCYTILEKVKGIYSQTRSNHRVQKTTIGSRQPLPVGPNCFCYGQNH